jgi:hypothetical protein
MSSQRQSLDQVRKLAGSELSLRARLGYVALLLVSVAMSVVTLSLWITETGLPSRTRWAFGAMTLIGVSWAALAAWALAARRPLYARDRVIAGRLAVTFTSLFMAAAIAAAILATSPATMGALGAGVVMLVLAIRVLADARAWFAALDGRRRELESGPAGLRRVTWAE